MKIRTFYLWGAAALLLLALAGFATLGTFTRFHADDFCMAADAAQIGLVGMLGKWYAEWTGRFMFILATGLLGLAGPGFAGWVPALAETAWLAALSWAIFPLIRRAGWPRPRLLALISASFGLIVLLASIPNLFQSFFWQDGFVNYSLPLIGLTLICGLISRVWLHPMNPWASGSVVFLLAFLCGGFTEAYAAMQVTLFVLAISTALAAGNLVDRRRLVPVLGAALAGGLLAMMIVIAAPGNEVRSGVVGDHPGLVRIVSFSIRNAAYIFGKFFIQTPIWAFLSISLPFLAGWLFSSPGAAAVERQDSPAWWRQRWLRRVVWAGLAAFILVTAACAPVVYAINAYPDDRTIIIPQFAIAAFVIGASALLGDGLRRSNFLPDPGAKPGLRRILLIGVAAALLLAAGYAIWLNAAQVPDYRQYAGAWDQRAAVIQQAAESGQSDLTVGGLNARFGVADLGESPDNWVNRCMGNYYGIRNLSGQ